jgi:hypothetical protein
LKEVPDKNLSLQLNTLILPDLIQAQSHFMPRMWRQKRSERQKSNLTFDVLILFKFSMFFLTFDILIFDVLTLSCQSAV